MLQIVLVSFLALVLAVVLMFVLMHATNCTRVFSCTCALQGRAMASIAQRLVTLCATLGEFPHIRFAADGGGRTEGVARSFQVRYCCFACEYQPTQFLT